MSTLNFASIPNNAATPWWKDAGLRACVLRICILYSAVFSLGYDGSLLTGLQALSPWTRDFSHPAGYTLGLISASYYLPKIPVSLLVPYFADKYGRKILLYAASIFLLVGAIIGGSSDGRRGQLIGSRVLLGIGTATGQIAASSLIPELAHPRIRHMCGSYLNTTYFIGSIMASWLCFGMVYYPGASSWAWRAPVYVQGFGALVLLGGTFTVPESPRWLVKNNRQEEAQIILAKYHANGKMDDPLILFELKEIEAAVVTERLANTGTWTGFVVNSGGRRRLGIIFLLAGAAQLGGSGIVSFYLVPVLKQVGIVKPAQTTGINGGLAIWSYVCALTGAGLVERFGRRPLFLTSIAGMLACFTVMAGVSGSYAHTHHKATGIAIVPVLFMFNGFYAIALTPIPSMYIPEISPLSMRAKSVALYVFSSSIFQAFNQFVNPIALKAITWKCELVLPLVSSKKRSLTNLCSTDYFVYIASLVFFLAMFFIFLRETKGLTTEEAAVVYDPEDKREAALEAEQKLRQAAEAAVLDKSSKGSIEHVDSRDV